MTIDKLFNFNNIQVFGLIILIIGFAILCMTVIAISNSVSAKEWSIIMGKIIKSDIYELQFGGESNATFRPDIAFEYNVNGEKYISDRLYYGVKIMSSFNWIKSRKLVEKYPVNKEVKVYFNPNKPSESVVEPGIHVDLGVIFIFAIFFVICGFLLYINSDFVIKLFGKIK